MGQLQWSERLEIDQGGIDREHRNWIDIANRILYTDPREKELLLQALNDLAAFTRKHFVNEELALKQISYDRLHIQVLKHKVILAEMRYTIENMPQLEELHEALSRLIHEWVEGHIIGEDLLIKRYY